MNDYRDAQWLHQKYVVEVMHIKDIADMCGVGSGTVGKWVTRHALPRHGTPIEAECGTCNTPVRVHQYMAKKTARSFCSYECWRTRPNRRTADRTLPEYRCPNCKQMCPRDAFPWFELSDGTMQRRGYCFGCQRQRRAARYRENRDSEHLSHALWCAERESTRDERSLRWHFGRQLASIRSRTRDLRLPSPDIDADYLVGLYATQRGRCYYTGVDMYWGRDGQKRRIELMSIDKLTPSLGYVKGNVVLCTAITNTSKFNRTEDEFYEFCELVLRNRTERARRTA